MVNQFVWHDRAEVNLLTIQRQYSMVATSILQGGSEIECNLMGYRLRTLSWVCKPKPISLQQKPLCTINSPMPMLRQFARCPSNSRYGGTTAKYSHIEQQNNLLIYICKAHSNFTNSNCSAGYWASLTRAHRPRSDNSVLADYFSSPALGLPNYPNMLSFTSRPLQGQPATARLTR